MFTLRPYQEKLVDQIYAHWAAGFPNVLAALPTGAGKAVIVCYILSKHIGPSCIVAHRQELVGQLCLTLAQFNVRHRIIGPKSLIQMVVQIQMDELGASFYDPSAPCGVAGVDTLIRRQEPLATWANSVTLVIQDECHHILAKSSTGKPNKWGTAQLMFPNARGLGVTATPGRADGRGLGRHTDGFYDCLILGPGMRELINMGALSEYRIFAPPSDLDLSHVKISDATGDFNKDQLRKEVHRSHIVGDVVEQYQKITPGKRGVVFAVDVATAVEISGRFQAAGIPTEVVSAKTPDRIRHELIRRFRRGGLNVLVNVDLFGEGFDLPAIEVVMMTRPTHSYAVFSQQFGRALRPMPDKKHAFIIDHVGNTMRHGLPDADRAWALDRRERGTRGKRDPNVMPITTCTVCFSPYEAVHKACPFCGAVPTPAGRSLPIQVDGDLFELDASTLAKMRGEIAKVDLSENEVRRWLDGQHMTHAIKGNILKNHRNRQEAQVSLRNVISWWAGWQHHQNRPDSESYRRFFHSFGVDIATAQTLGKADASALADKVWRTMT